jgi:hypothetical protein
LDAVEKKYHSCHGCLLLAVYGLYKNGIIKNTPRPIVTRVDFTGFNGQESLDIHHAFDAIDMLKNDFSLKPSHLKEHLGGEMSIYSFVVHYFHQELLNQLLK